MRKRRALLLSLICGAVTLALVRSLKRNNEPIYEGKTLSKWVAICTKETWQDQGWGTNTAGHVEAINAIRQVGTNALPLLLRLIDDPPRGLWLRTGDLFERLPERITRSATAHWLRQQHQHIVLVADDAQPFSQALGPIAAPIIPDLIQRLSSTNWTGRRDLALLALFHIETHEDLKDTAPIYAKYLNDPDPKTRNVAIWALLRIAAPEVLTNGPAQ